MALRLVCGPTGSGKTTRAVEAFLASLERGEKAVFIAPSGPDARHFERQIIRKLGSGGGPGVLTGGRVTTFDGLCREVLGAAEPGAKTLSPNERFLLLRALVDAAANLRVLAQSSGSDGFITALADLFSEFGAAGIDSTGMAKKLRSWAKNNKWRQNLNKDLYSLYGRYEEVLRENAIYDHELSGRRAIELLREDGILLAYDAVIIDGFRDFTPIQKDLLGAVASHSRDVLVTLPHDAGRLAYQAPSSYLEPLEKILGPAEYLVDLEARSDRVPALDHLVGNLLLEEPGVADADGAVERLLAAGSRGQAEMVAAEVLKLFRSGHELDEIAVVCRSLGPETAMLAEVFEEFGVPYELSAPINLADTAVGKTAAAALDFAAGSRSRASLISYLRSPLSNIDGDMVDSFERKCRRQAIDDDALLLEWRGRALDEFDLISRSLSQGPGSAGEALCGVISGLMAEKGYVSRVSGEDLRLDVLSLEALRGVCNETAAIGGLPGVALAGGGNGAGSIVSRLLLAGIGRATVRLPGGNIRGCVRILDPHRILNQRFDTVFVCGLLEKQFPNFGREDPFFSDAARKELACEFELPLDSGETRLAEERFLFFRTLSRARSKIFLCYPSCDSEGKPTNRSLFIDDVLELFKEKTVKARERRISDVAFAIGDAPTVGQALRSIAIRNDSGKSREQLVRIAASVGLGERLEFCLDSSIPRAPKLDEASILERLGKLDDFRVTELQRYLNCPLIYFVESVLNPSPFEPAAKGLHRGQMMHNILCRFNGQLSRADLYLYDAKPSQVEELRRQMVRYIEEEFIDAGSDLDALILKTELFFHLNRYIDREIACARRMQYYDVEVSFGGGKSRCGGRNSTPQALVLGDFRVRGRLDRVDWSGDSNRALVIDYKSGRHAVSSARFEESKEIQVPLYMLALKEAFGMAPIGGEYYAIRGEERGGLYLSGHESELGADCGEIKAKDFVDAEIFSARLQGAADLAAAAVKDIRQGIFPCEPSDDKRICGYCDYAGICRRQAIPQWMENVD